MRVGIFTNNDGSSAKKRSRLLYICAAFPVALALFALSGCDWGGDPAWYGVGTRYYTITFSGNGYDDGSAPAPIKAADSSYITLPGQGSMIKNGYTFNGWHTYSNYASYGTRYDGGSPYKIGSRSLTLYAIWIAEVVAPDTYIVEVTSAGMGSEGSGSYAVGATVSISAGTPPEGEVFTGWTSSSDGVVFTDASEATTTFIMPGNDVTVEAVFEEESTSTPTTYAVTVTGGTGSEIYEAGETVSITADEAPEGKVFKNWTSSSDGVVFADANSAATTFTMPENDVRVEAVFEPIKYTLTVTGSDGSGSESGNYAAGDWVWITAWYGEGGPLQQGIEMLMVTPPPEQVFKYWTSSSNGASFTDASVPTIRFIMPPNDVTVTAVYEPTISPPPEYTVTVIAGETIGGNRYTAAMEVTITAGTPPLGQQFKKWTTESPGVNFADSNDATTTFIMPQGSVTVTAVFESMTVKGYPICNECVSSNFIVPAGAWKLSDFERPGLQMNTRGNYWFPYDDAEMGGTSEITGGLMEDSYTGKFTVLEVDGNGKGVNLSNGVYIEFELGDEINYRGVSLNPFVGVGTGVYTSGTNAPYNAGRRADAGLHFQYRTSPECEYLIVEVHDKYANGEFYYVELPGTGSTSTWRSATIPFSRLRLPDWASVRTGANLYFNKEAIEALMFKISAAPGIAGFFAIDNVYIIGTSPDGL